MSAVPVVCSIHTWTVDVITTVPADGTVRPTMWMFVQPAIGRPPLCHGVLRVLFMRVPAPAGPAGPGGPTSPVSPRGPVGPAGPCGP